MNFNAYLKALLNSSTSTFLSKEYAKVQSFRMSIMIAVIVSMSLMLLLAQSQIVEIEKAVSGRSLQDHPMDSLQELSSKDSEKRQYAKVSLS
jgi:hypothetical protein